MRIAVIAAPNQGYMNTGMLTVDLAAAGVLKRAVPNARLSWYTLHPPTQFGDVHPFLDPSELPFDWRSLIEHFDDVCAHDAILLWGDFLQARHYFEQDASDRLILASNARLSSEHALEILYRCLLFGDASPDVLRKIVVFGSTILFNRQTDYARDRYGACLFRLLRNCGGVWAREPVSAMKIQHVRQDYESACLGTDAAFLLRDDDVARLSTTRWIDHPPFADRVGLFFGVRTRPPLALLGFLRRLTQRLGLHLEWLPWFPLHEWLRAVPGHPWLHPVRTALLLKGRRTIDGLMRRGGHYSAGDLLAAVGRYRFIVTDTYHLCVNAWRVGTPAICFGSSEESLKHRSLDDYKKRVLYEMYDASDFYFSTSTIGRSVGRRRALDTMGQLLADESLGAAIAARIRAHAREVERALALRLNGLVTA